MVNPHLGLMFSSSYHLLAHRVQSLSHWQLDLMVIVLLLQGAVAAVIPEELIILSMGVFLSHHKVAWLEAILAIQLGLLPANLMMVFLASRMGPRLLGSRPFCWILRPNAVAHAQKQFEKRGAWIVFITRFVPTIRGPVYVAAGFSQIGLLRFASVDALASTIQIPLLLWLGSCGLLLN